MTETKMSRADVRRVERMVKAAGKLVDMMDDALMRGLIEDFNARTMGGRGLRYDLADFHDWHAGRLSRLREDGGDG